MMIGFGRQSSDLFGHHDLVERAVLPVFDVIHQPLNQIDPNTPALAKLDAFFDVRLLIGFGVVPLPMVADHNLENLMTTCHLHRHCLCGIELVCMLDDVGVGLIHRQANFVGLLHREAALFGMKSDKVPHLGDVLRCGVNQ